MPIIKSAKKALRQARRRTEVNSEWKKKVKTSVKSVLMYEVSTSSIDYWTSFRNTKQAISRDVRVKFIGSFNEKNNKIVKRWLSAGAEYRIYDEKKFGPQGIRFGTFDDKSCRLTIGKPDIQKPEDYITIWSESPSFVNLLKRQFYFMWEQCKPPKI